MHRIPDMTQVDLPEIHDREVTERERSLGYSIGMLAALAVVIAGVIYAAIMIARTVG